MNARNATIYFHRVFIEPIHLCASNQIDYNDFQSVEAC